MIAYKVPGTERGNLVDVIGLLFRNCFFPHRTPFQVLYSVHWLILSNLVFLVPQGSEWNASNLEDLQNRG